MKKNYYYTAISLPEITFEAAPDLDFNTLTESLKDNLTSKDYEQVRVLRRYYDIQNIRSFLKEEELSPFGNFDENALEEALVARVGFPEYVYDYLEKYPKSDEQLQYFPALLAAYFREELKHAEGFLKQYLAFERNLRFVLTGFRAKATDRDVAQELQFEDPDELIVAQILAQKDARVFEPPEGFEDLKAFLNDNAEDPMALKKGLAHYRFKEVEKIKGLNLFNDYYILGYYVQYMLVRDWFSMNKKKGLQIVDAILKGGS